MTKKSDPENSPKHSPEVETVPNKPTNVSKLSTDDNPKLTPKTPTTGEHENAASLDSEYNKNHEYDPNHEYNTNLLAITTAERPADTDTNSSVPQGVISPEVDRLQDAYKAKGGIEGAAERDPQLGANELPDGV